MSSIEEQFDCVLSSLSYLSSSSIQSKDITFLTNLLQSMPESEICHLAKRKESGQDMTILHVAIKLGLRNIIDSISACLPKEQLYSSLLVKDKAGNTPLHYVRNLKSESTAIDIMEKFASKFGRGKEKLISLQNKDKETVMHLIVQQNYKKLLCKVLDLFPNDCPVDTIQLPDVNGDTILHCSAKNEATSDIVEAILGYVPDAVKFDLISCKNEEKKSPLQLSCTHSGKAFSFLIEALQPKDLDRLTKQRCGDCLYIQDVLIDGKPCHITKFLCHLPEKRAFELLKTPIVNGWNSLHVYAQDENTAAIDGIFEDVISSDERFELLMLVDEWGRTPLHYGAEVQSCEVIKSLITRLPNDQLLSLMLQVDRSGETPIERLLLTTNILKIFPLLVKPIVHFLLESHDHLRHDVSSSTGGVFPDENFLEDHLPDDTLEMYGAHALFPAEQPQHLGDEFKSVRKLWRKLENFVREPDEQGGDVDAGSRVAEVRVHALECYIDRQTSHLADKEQRIKELEAEIVELKKSKASSEGNQPHGLPGADVADDASIKDQPRLGKRAVTDVEHASHDAADKLSGPPQKKRKVPGNVSSTKDVGQEPQAGPSHSIGSEQQQALVLSTDESDDDSTNSACSKPSSPRKHGDEGDDDSVDYSYFEDHGIPEPLNALLVKMCKDLHVTEFEFFQKPITFDEITIVGRGTSNITQKHLNEVKGTRWSYEIKTQERNDYSYTKQYAANAQIRQFELIDLRGTSELLVESLDDADKWRQYAVGSAHCMFPAMTNRRLQRGEGLAETRREVERRPTQKHYKLRFRLEGNNFKEIDAYHPPIFSYRYCTNPNVPHVNHVHDNMPLSTHCLSDIVLLRVRKSKAEQMYNHLRLDSRIRRDKLVAFDSEAKLRAYISAESKVPYRKIIVKVKDSYGFLVCNAQTMNEQRQFGNGYHLVFTLADGAERLVDGDSGCIVFEVRANDTLHPLGIFLGESTDPYNAGRYKAGILDLCLKDVRHQNNGLLATVPSLIGSGLRPNAERARHGQQPTEHD